MNSRDIEANKKIFVAMGGTAVKNGNFDIVKFPGVVVFLIKARRGAGRRRFRRHGGEPCRLPRANVQDRWPNGRPRAYRLSRAGNGGWTKPSVTTPDWLRIGILEDKGTDNPIRHHTPLPPGSIGTPAAFHLAIDAWTFGTKEADMVHTVADGNRPTAGAAPGP